MYIKERFLPHWETLPPTHHRTVSVGSPSDSSDGEAWKSLCGFTDTGRGCVRRRALGHPGGLHASNVVMMMRALHQGHDRNEHGVPFSHCCWMLLSNYDELCIEYYIDLYLKYVYRVIYALCMVCAFLVSYKNISIPLIWHGRLLQRVAPNPGSTRCPTIDGPIYGRPAG